MATIIDGTQMYEDAIRRIRELEQLNSLLAEQIDRQRPVIDALRKSVNTTVMKTDWRHLLDLRIALREMIEKYDRDMAQLGQQACTPAPSSVEQERISCGGWGEGCEKEGRHGS